MDELEIRVRSGSGGHGCESHRKRADHKRVPDGGNGGNGGNIMLKADAQTGSLIALKSGRPIAAENGSPGMGNKRHGRNGRDHVVNVPCGTTVYNRRDRLLIRDLIRSGEEVLVLRGGKGGSGNHEGRPATLGEPGQDLALFLSFKILADIFLVGLPNSGKTTLLRKLTGAHVRETDYPFATKAPQLGTYQTHDRVFRICELPSIYAASGKGSGLGTHYLKHLERAKLVLFVVDLESKFASRPEVGFDLLLRTVAEFNPAFRHLPHLFVVNKIDLSRKRFSNHDRTFWVSAETGAGLRTLMKAAQDELESHHATTS